MQNNKYDIDESIQVFEIISVIALFLRVINFSGGFRGGSRGSLEPPSGTKLFRFHGEFKEILSEIRLTNPPFLHLNPLLKNPGSAPEFHSTIMIYKYKYK